MELVGGFIVIGCKGQVEFALAQVILLGMIPQGGQLQAEVGFAVTEKDNGEAAVGGFLAANLVEVQGLGVELQRSVQIGNIELKENAYMSVINFVDKADGIVFVLVCTLDLSE